jgi:hypothetical protein
VIATVAEYCGGSTAKFPVRRRGGESRNVAAWLTRRLTTATLRELARLFGLSYPGSVSNLLRRAERGKVTKGKNGSMQRNGTLLGNGPSRRSATGTEPVLLHVGRRRLVVDRPVALERCGLEGLDASAESSAGRVSRRRDFDSGATSGQPVGDSALDPPGRSRPSIDQEGTAARQGGSMERQHQRFKNVWLPCAGMLTCMSASSKIPRKHYL